MTREHFDPHNNWLRPGLFHGIYGDYGYGWLAIHEFLYRHCRESESGTYEGLWLAAASAGDWYAFANAAVVSERPSHISLDVGGRLHDSKGPALVFPSGLEIFAWQGYRVPKNWILDPDSLKQQMRGNRELIIDIYGRQQYERELAAKKQRTR